MGAIDWSECPDVVVFPDGSATTNRGPCGTCGARVKVVWDDGKRYHTQCGRCVDAPKGAERVGTFDTDTGIFEIKLTKRVREYRERISQADQPFDHADRG